MRIGVGLTVIGRESEDDVRAAIVLRGERQASVCGRANALLDRMS